ncbi:hypothetical protein OESDEN_14844 [Oesophagostomum dentatum]|uniref:ENPP1-3/EXOG-like endonuclease/phosphodiesterase domain-containing protein n=1 Tax=Oesophagostomum dentatum TaxID=61180 RepID=A0A0B1SQD0_OESDE|nr:hypothetical protein OESDEN_14844 [Oesophagostomum dentatum]
MQTIFFAMGPSIKQGVVLPPVQTIQYLNLFIDLLGLPQNVPNNGTLGIMDEILVHPPLRAPQFHFPISECLAIGAPAAVGCNSCSAEIMKQLDADLKCTFPPNFPFQISSTTPRCIQNYCEKSVITGGGLESAVAVAERLVKGSTKSSSSCEFLNSKYINLCGTHKDTSDYVRKSISADTQSGFANIRSLVMPWKKGFVTDILDPLNDYTHSLLEKFGHLVSITGTAYDRNYDGIGDVEMRSTPSHIYRVLITCNGAWSNDGASCAKPSDTRVLSFIFPVMEKDSNCLPKDQLLLEYTARLQDVELISGLVFQFPGLSHMELLRLKTNVTTQLW